MFKLWILLSIGVFAYSATPAKKSRVAEAYRAAILQAQEHTLNQDRKKAAKVIVEALEREPRDSKGYKELKKSLSSLAEMFYTEKAQKIFESGRSSIESDISTALDRFREALDLEPGNVRVLREYSRAFLIKGDCKKSLDLTKEAMLLNPFSSDLFLLRLQSKSCLGQTDDFDAELSNPFVEKEEVALYVDLLRAQASLAEDRAAEAIEILERIKKKDVKFPETYLWLGRSKQKLGRKAASDFQEYLSLCRQANHQLKRTYYLEPRVCGEVLAAEKSLETLKSEAGS